MEATEFGADDQEHPVKWLRILNSGKEAWIESETERYFCRRIKVRFAVCGDKSQFTSSKIRLLIAFCFKETYRTAALNIRKAVMTIS